LTATPHRGKEWYFQSLLSLLAPGQYPVTANVWRRMLGVDKSTVIETVLRATSFSSPRFRTFKQPRN